MPIQNYGLLRGAIIDATPYASGADHYQIELNAAGTLYRIALDVYSALKGSKKHFSATGETVFSVDRELLFFKDEKYTHPLLAGLPAVQQGLSPATSLPKSLLLDYLRYQPALFPIAAMKSVPPKGPGADLNDDINPWVQKAKNNPNAEVFAFGSTWDDSTSSHPDPTIYFHPNPTLGIHDIHMNQGDSGTEAKGNGIFQDGALFFRFIGNGMGGADTWVAMFFRFANQSTTTDNNGNPTH